MNDKDIETIRQQALDLFREVSSESFYLGVDSIERKTGRGPFDDKYLNVFVDAVLGVVGITKETE